MSLIVEIASVPDRDNLVAEIWCDVNMVAEVSVIEKIYKIEVYPNPIEGVWRFNLAELIEALNIAQSRLSAL